MVKQDRIVHLLRAGQALCKQRYLAGAPATWPERDYWVAEKDAAKATCKRCITAHKKSLKGKHAH